MTLLAILVYLAVGTSSIALIVRVSASHRHHPGGGRIHDVYEAAFLSGGPARVVDAALAAMHADGRLAIGGPGIVALRHPLAHDLVERTVLDALAAAPTGALHQLRLTAMRGPAVQEIGDGLAARGLIVPPAQNRGLAVWGGAQGLLCVLALPLSFALTIISFVAAGPAESGTPFIAIVLPALIAGLVIGFMMAGRARRRISTPGRNALRSYQAEFAVAHTPARLVAIHGLRGIPDPALRAQLTAAARVPARGGGRSVPYRSDSSSSDFAAVWCAGAGPGSGCGGSSGGGSGCGGSSGGGSSCGGSSGGGSSCSSSSGGSSCGGGSSSS